MLDNSLAKLGMPLTAGTAIDVRGRCGRRNKTWKRCGNSLATKPERGRERAGENVTFRTIRVEACVLPSSPPRSTGTRSPSPPQFRLKNHEMPRKIRSGPPAIGDSACRQGRCSGVLVLLRSVVAKLHGTGCGQQSGAHHKPEAIES